MDFLMQISTDYSSSSTDSNTERKNDWILSYSS